jgi:hypothetical protein
MKTNAQLCDDNFSPDPPPPQGACELHDRVDLIVFDLEQAANGHQPAERLARALLGLAAERRTGVISEAMQEQLVRALVHFNEAADRVLPADIAREDIRVGLSAALVQIAYWAATDEERATFRFLAFCDMEDYARVLRDAANISATRANLKAREPERRRVEALDNFHPSSALGETSH